MAKNKLTDLNNHLFMALERLNDEGLSDENIAIEVERANAISTVADKIIANAKVSLEAMKLVAHGDVSKGDLPELLSNKLLG